MESDTCDEWGNYMKMECYGTMTTKVTINPVDVIHGLITKYFGGGGLFIKDDSLYRQTLTEGYRSFDYVNELVTNDSDKIELYKALNLVKETLYKDANVNK